MAALYLHNALFSVHRSQPESEPGRSTATDLTLPPPVHSRSSLTTLRTSVSFSGSDFQDTIGGGLLAPDVVPTAAAAYVDLLASQPAHPNDHPTERKGPTLDLSGELRDPAVDERERNEEHARRIQQPQWRLWRAILAFEILIGAWSTYSVTRYSIAYLGLAAPQAVPVSLALTTTSTFSLSSLASAILLRIFQPQLSLGLNATRNFHVARVALHAFSSLSLLATAAINFTLAFAWRRSPVVDLRVEGRCHLDIDVVWSSPPARCDSSHPPPWRTWLAIAAVRLFLTASILVAYHLVAQSYYLARRSSSLSCLFFTKRSARATGPELHQGPSATHAVANLSILQPQPPRSLQLSPPSVLLPPRKSLPYPSIDSSHALPPSESRSPSTHSSQSRGASSSSSRTLYAPGSDYDHMNALRSSVDTLPSSVSKSLPHDSGSAVPSTSTADVGTGAHHAFEAEMQTVARRLRSIVNQMATATAPWHALHGAGEDDAVGLGGTPFTTATTATASMTRTNTASMTAAEAAATVAMVMEAGAGVQAGGQRSHGGQRFHGGHVRMLGNYVQRMPTIESLGSHELGNSSSTPPSTSVSGAGTSSSGSHVPRRGNIHTRANWSGVSQPPASSPPSTSTSPASSHPSMRGETGTAWSEMVVVSEPHCISLPSSPPSYTSPAPSPLTRGNADPVWSATATAPSEALGALSLPSLLPPPSTSPVLSQQEVEVVWLAAAVESGPRDGAMDRGTGHEPPSPSSSTDAGSSDAHSHVGNLGHDGQQCGANQDGR